MNFSLRSFLAKPLRWIKATEGARRRRRRASEYLSHIKSLAEGEGTAAQTLPPFVSLLVPVFNTKPHYLNQLLASVRAQLPGSWELILSDDGSTEPTTRRWLERHQSAPDIKILRHPENCGIVAATNAAIAVAKAPWITFLDHDDLLTPNALATIQRALTSARDCCFLYTDEVIADAKGRPVDFFLKPAFDPVLLSGVNYLNHLSLYRRDRVLALGGLRKDFEGSQDHDLALRYTRTLGPGQALHLPYPAYIWRRDGQSYSARFMDKATRNARKSLAEAFEREGCRPQVDAAPGGLHRIRFDQVCTEWPLVSVVIPSRNAFELIDRLLSGLCECTNYPNLEIIVIDNGSIDPKVLALYERLRNGVIPFQAVIESEPFNFSLSINKGVAKAKGDYVLWLNNDIEMREPDWLREMVSCFAYPNVGIVGAKLLYPNGTHQHAGVIVGFGGLAGHWFLETPEDFPGPMGRLWVRQSFSAVTGACMLVSRACFEAVGELDEGLFAIGYNDVDFCLRSRERGFRVVWTPFATLIHHESASRGSDETEANIARFQLEQENLRRRHATDRYDDFAISPWYSKDRSLPEPMRLSKLPEAR